MYKIIITIVALTIFSISNSQACFLSGETISGMNKICFYDCISGTKAITISSVSLCPLSIAFKKLEKDPKNPILLQEVKNILRTEDYKMYSSLCDDASVNNIS
jgi:hypothetical protein